MTAGTIGPALSGLVAAERRVIHMNNIFFVFCQAVKPTVGDILVFPL